MQNKVLFVAYDYPPILSPESIQVQRRAIALAENGVEVFILTAHAMPQFEGIDPSLVKTHSRITVLQTKKPLFEKLKNIFFKFLEVTDRKLWWKYVAIEKAASIIKNEQIDTIYTHSSPLVDHLVGLDIKQQFPNVKHIAHFSDPWTSNPYVQYRFKWQEQVNRRLEQRIFSSADFVTVTSEKTKKLFHLKHHIELDRMGVLPHVFDSSCYRETTTNIDKVEIVHTGNIYGLRTIRYLLEALKAFDSDKYLFKFYGKVKPEEKELVMKMGLEHQIHIYDQVSYSESLDIISSADMLLVIDAPLAESPFFPSKLADYIGANKPIIALTPQDSTTADIVNRLSSHSLIADSGNMDEILALLKTLNSMDNFSIDKDILFHYDMKNFDMLKEVFCE